MHMKSVEYFIYYRATTRRFYAKCCSMYFCYDAKTRKWRRAYIEGWKGLILLKKVDRLTLLCEGIPPLITCSSK